MRLEANGGTGKQAETSQEAETFEGEQGEAARIEGGGGGFPWKWKFFEVLGLPFAHEPDKAAGH